MTSLRFSGEYPADTTFDPAHSSSQRSVDLTDGTPPPSRQSVKMTLTGSSSPGERYFFVLPLPFAGDPLRSEAGPDPGKARSPAEWRTEATAPRSAAYATAA